MGYEKHNQSIDKDNYHNGNYRKKVKITHGEIDISIPRDIRKSIKDIYDVDVSATMMSEIRDGIIPVALEWQNDTLNAVYPIVFIDCVYFNVQTEYMFTQCNYFSSYTL